MSLEIDGLVTARHTDLVLERMAVHVGDELRTIGALTFEAAAAGDSPVGRAVFEAYLHHVRTVGLFLGTAATRAWPDDVVADDYFETPGRTFDPLSADDRRDIDGHLARLTVERLLPDASHLTGDRSYWGRRVLKKFDLFVETLRAESPARATWFEGALTDAKRSAVPPRPAA